MTKIRTTDDLFEFLERSFDWGMIVMIPFMILGGALAIIVGIPCAMIEASLEKGKK